MRNVLSPTEAHLRASRSVATRARPGLTQARYDRDAAENGVVINLANVVSVRVSKADGAATGQYL